MDHQAKSSLSRGQAPSIIRNRRVVAVAASAAAVGMVIKLRADAIKKNEMAQKNSAVPNFYVSVERSGGGI
ncbi:hypothetical protein MCOR27_001223 [Pyricularia oryzae]|uniref:Uncharacterized protein n=4 Tax=Pyricularia TaxID=48558 RepID=A0ABQ8N459_PYRGI|nr:uncharacterized protein MGG_01539 [Pyricularia oryzae 70-15]ELQ37463.1 hypothetical protein OOU_Y34scaffold00592g11 [Pyricularia oryzae Y34]KAH8838938.1 hypothetical protein MCOR01_008180 [Pyricularia oryzae]KAI6290941.1 hypothetical protein MCOR33_010946 [Pyricularia grisea]EHA54705.1 hypothetical protein MGG_01539 [Pyricularia oryzae 70-15]KAH9438769.1 hypothetical protein MCOR02_002371 [Pyricularia oryzae]